MSSQSKRRIPVLAASIIIVVLFSYIIFAQSFVTSFEENVTLYSYNASNYEVGGTPKTDMYGQTRAFIDPDGLVKTGTYLGYRPGSVTGLHIDVSPIKPINYISGRYRSVERIEDWRPSEEWQVDLASGPHQINVYRSVFGISVTTATNTPSEGTEEVNPIQNLRITLQIELPQWETVTDAEVGIGYIYIPPQSEVTGTALDPTVRVTVIDAQKRSYLFGLIDAFSWNKAPYIAPWAPGVRLWGSVVSVGSSPIGAPTAVLINLDWASISPGVQDVGWVAEERADVSMDLKFVMLHMAARPLYVPAGQDGTDPGVGGVPQPEPSCSFLEDGIRDSYGKVQYCQSKDILGSLTMIFGLIFGTIIAIVVIILILKYTVFKETTRRLR